jgi:3-hydroxybutyryl-CoA dehydrogenase
MAIMAAALDFLGRGVATLEEIDFAFTRGLGPRLSVMGPFKTMDLIGLDLIWQSILSFDPNAHNDPRAARIRELVQAGEFGIKTGRGFYDYGGHSRDETMLEIDGQLLKILAHNPVEKKGGTHAHGI